MACFKTPVFQHQMWCCWCCCFFLCFNWTKWFDLFLFVIIFAQIYNVIHLYPTRVKIIIKVRLFNWIKFTQTLCLHRNFFFHNKIKRNYNSIPLKGYVNKLWFVKKICYVILPHPQNRSHWKKMIQQNKSTGKNIV